MKRLSTAFVRARSNNESVQSSPDVSRKYGIMGSLSSLGSRLTNVSMGLQASEVFCSISLNSRGTNIYSHKLCVNCEMLFSNIRSDPT